MTKQDSKVKRERNRVGKLKNSEEKERERCSKIEIG